MPDKGDEANGGGAGGDRMEALAALTGAFAHDFNNLLTVIRGSAELLEGRLGDADGAVPEVHAIVDAADRAARLTTSLLAFSRRLPLHPEPVDLAAAAAAERDRVAMRTGGAVTVRLMVPRGLPPVFVDPAQFALVLGAAVENALEAMPGGGVLTLAAAVQGEGAKAVRFAVIDSGAGMAATVAEHAFDPFFTTKALGSGPGLGLSLVHGFARQSGGSAAIESAPGRGTTLTLILPTAPAKAAPLAPAGNAPARGTRVLLVEDSDTVAAFAEALLADMGLVVIRAANGEEALVALEEQPAFDILFSDIVMPGMSGLELAERVRAGRPQLPILLATGYSEEAAKQGSCFPILPKPYRRDALAAMMSRAMAA